MPTNIRERRGLRGAASTLVIIASCALAVEPAAGEQSATKFKSSDRVVPVHNKITLRGSLPVVPVPASTSQAEDESTDGTTLPTRKPKKVRNTRAKIQFKAIGAKHWQDLRTFRTGKAGRFKERIKPPRSGRFRVQSAHGTATRPIAVSVRAKIAGSVDRRGKVGERARVRGRVFPIGRGRPVSVRVEGRTLRTKTGRNGRFSLGFKPKSAGTSKVRIRAKGNKIATGNSSRAGRITVFRPAYASYYGPGFYGGVMACGGRLGTGTIGVAHKTLPCGTKLTLRLGSRTVNARVIDRGPFVAGREFDLTSATKQRLGFGDVGTIWVDR